MPATVSCSLAPCAAQTHSVIADLREIANIIFAHLRSRYSVLAKVGTKVKLYCHVD